MPTNTYVALDKVTVGTATPSITFTGINQGYTDLVLVSNATPTTSGGIDLYLTVNGDTTSGLYSKTHLAGYGTSAGSTRLTGQNRIATFWQVGPENTQPFTVNYSLQNYANSSVFKTVLARAGAFQSSASEVNAFVGLWRNTNAITSVTLTASSGNFAVGSTFSLYGIKAEPFAAKATGGTITYAADGYTYHTFTSSGTFTPSVALSCDALVIAGGGGGGQLSGGGGGAGGVIYFENTAVTVGSKTITVGGGGAGSSTGSTTGSSGASSTFASLTSGSGGGGGGSSVVGANGGSGGGGGNTRAGGTSNQSSTGATAIYGNTGAAGGTSGGSVPAGGGGGAGGAGINVVGNGNGGNGGASTSAFASWAAATLTGVSGAYAGGGGGGSGSGTRSTATGGGGGGGIISPNDLGISATANTGSGGGGGGRGGPNTGGNGGSGIVIIRYVSA